jgi:hypothetical protein
MTPMSAQSSSQQLVSGTFKVSKHRSVTGLRANITAGPDYICSGGVLTIAGSQGLIFTKNTSNLLGDGVDHGHNEWAVATSGGAANAALVQPTAVTVTDHASGAASPGSLSIVFASGKSKGIGRIAWGATGSGINDACGFTFSVQRG